MAKPVLSKADTQQFCELFRKARQDAGLSHLQLSATSGVSVQYLQQVEEGKARLSLARMRRILTSLPRSRDSAKLQDLYGKAAARRVKSNPELKITPDTVIAISDLIRRAREDAGLSLRQLARGARVDPMALSRMERGLVRRTDWTKVAAIAAQVPLSQLAEKAKTSGARQVRHASLKTASDLEQTLNSFPEEVRKNEEWVRAISKCLQGCMRAVNRK